MYAHTTVLSVFIRQSKNKSAISYDYESQQQITADTNKKKRLEDDDKDSNDETEDGNNQ